MKSKGDLISTFTEDHRKVRKLTGGQKCNTRTISAVLIQILDLMALITPG